MHWGGATRRRNHCIRTCTQDVWEDCGNFHERNESSLVAYRVRKFGEAVSRKVRPTAVRRDVRERQSG